MRRAVGRARPVALATSLSDIPAVPGWNALMTSNPRAIDSMKSGSASRRGMTTSLGVRGGLWPGPPPVRTGDEAAGRLSDSLDSIPGNGALTLKQTGRTLT